MKKISQFIKDLLKASGMDAVTLSKKIGVTEMAVSHWKHGNRPPNVKNAKKLLRLAAKYDIIVLLDEIL